MKKQKNNIKYLALLLVPVIFYFLSGFINLYWLPLEVRLFVANHKFDTGECISASKEWGVNPKKVVDFKVKNKEIVYLLKDADRYEHLSYIPKYLVEKHAFKVNCPR